MKSINDHKGLLIGWLILLVIVIGATTQLAGKKQDTRKAAYFAGTDVILMPNEVVKKVGEEFPVELLVETKAASGGELAKVDFVESKLCFGPELSIDAKDLKQKVSLGSFFSEFLNLEVVKESDKSCLKMVIVSDKPDEELGKGMVKVATVKFTTVKDGSGKISIDETTTKVSGSNPDKKSQDMAMQLGTIGGVDYKVGTGVAKKECQWWNIVCLVGRMLGK